MLKLTVSPMDTFLGAAVTALVREMFPTVDLGACEERQVADDGVVVSFAESGRWLFVAAAPGPSNGAVEALSRGASAVITLSTPRTEFEFALRSVVDGGPGHVPLDLVRWMAGEALERGNTARVKPALTSREREILQFVARGFTNAEIGETLLISTNTVRTHLHALSVKFEASNRTRMLANARALAVPEAFEAGDAA